MKYLSVCSGIEAATVAWHPLGWTTEAYAEIEKFPSAVLAHHYPDAPNWGDMTKFKEWPDAVIDVLVGGTPCQSFSVAGLRKGLADPRGNLALTYLAIADRYRPKWLVWENVPGVLSSDGGRDFGSFLGALGQLRYGFAYRVLDAQYCGVPQRRRRVFVVGYLGDWTRAAAVLFERESLQGNPPPSRKTGEGITGGAESRAYGGNNQAGPIDVATAVNAHGGPHGRQDFESETFVAEHAPALSASNPYGDHEAREGLLVAHSLRGEGFDASEDGTGRGTPLVPIDFDSKASSTHMPNPSSEVTPPLRAMGHADSHDNAGGQLAVAFAQNRRGELRTSDIAPQSQPLMGNGPVGGNQGGDVLLEPTMAVRRLTPVECERLQGFPDNYTQIPWCGKSAEECPDGPRYKALGNSMAVPVMSWVGGRIQTINTILEAEAA